MTKELHGMDILTEAIPPNINHVYGRFAAGVTFRNDYKIADYFVYLIDADNNEYTNHWIIDMGELYDIINDTSEEELINIIKTNFINPRIETSVDSTRMVGFAVSNYIKGGDDYELAQYNKLSEARIKALGFRNKDDYRNYKIEKENEKLKTVIMQLI